MEWVQFVGILISIFGLVGFLYKEIKDWRAETRQEIKSIREEISLTQKNFQEEIRLQAKRSDRLYEIVIDLLKHPKTNP